MTAPIPVVGGRGPDVPAIRSSPMRRGEPWTNSRFWLLQVVVLALYLVRLAATVGFHLDSSSPAVELTTVAIFLVPVIVAALNYGLAGAVCTSAWVTLLAVPRFAMYLSNDNVTGAWSELMQVLVLNVIAVLVGHRVSAERQARSEAQSAELAHQRAEALYRDLFDSNQAPILITDGEGRVVEANASALHLFPGATPDAGAPPAHPLPRLLDVIGADAAAQVLTLLVSARTGTGGAGRAAADSERLPPVAFDVDGDWVLFRPTASALRGADGIYGMQVVFEDVTAETQRRDRMEAYAAQVVRGQEDERRRLAQELHDGPLQTLIHLCRQIDTAATAAGEGGARLADLRHTVEDTVAELRGIARGLRPPILDDLGLVSSVGQLLADAGGRNSFTTTMELTGAERRLSSDVELALFRVCQEALSNVERHARASEVAVALGFRADGVHLVISDDGIGLPEAGTDHPGPGGASLGLPGMAERAHLIGGSFTIRSPDTGGTAVEVWVPEGHAPQS